MNLFGLNITWSRKSTSESLDINTLLSRWEQLYATAAGIVVTPETAMQSPTVRAIVSAISRRIATLPIQVLRKTTVNGRTRKELLPDHPVALLLQKPNAILNPSKFWLDATSWLVRYGNYYAFKGQGNTGPVRRLIPLDPRGVTIQQDYTDIERITYRVTFPTGTSAEYEPNLILHARDTARDGICGNSIIADVRQAIALEIAAENFGAQFFGNGATPGLVIQVSPGSQGLKTDEDAKKVITAIEQAHGRFKRHGVFFLNKGLEIGQQVPIENEKAQFLGLRQYQRTVIAGAFGVPPHLVGDLTKMTFGNVEQQSLDFVTNVVQPFCKIFEDAMEQSLLTDEDRRNGIIIEFNLDAALRADFKTRQEGLNIQRTAGVISANEWREREGLNPISAQDGGDEYWRKGPSGQTANPPAEDEPEPTDEQDDSDVEDNDDAENS